MKKNDCDLKLKDELRQFILETENKTKENIEFSNIHKKKMKELFNSIQDNEKKDVRKSKNSNKVNDNNKIAIRWIDRINRGAVLKIAVFVLAAVSVVKIFSLDIMAWRPSEDKLYEEDGKKFSWVLPNDINGVLKEEYNENEEYLQVFGYLPGISYIDSININKHFQYAKIVLEQKDFSLRVDNELTQAVDTEDTLVSQEMIGDNQVSIIKRDERYIIIWNYDNRSYRVKSNMEYDTIKEIIENINYEKIEKYFE